MYGLKGLQFPYREIKIFEPTRFQSSDKYFREFFFL